MALAISVQYFVNSRARLRVKDWSNLFKLAVLQGSAVFSYKFTLSHNLWHLATIGGKEWLLKTR